MQTEADRVWMHNAALQLKDTNRAVVSASTGNNLRERIQRRNHKHTLAWSLPGPAWSLPGRPLPRFVLAWAQGRGSGGVGDPGWAQARARSGLVFQCLAEPRSRLGPEPGTSGWGWGRGPRNPRAPMGLLYGPMAPGPMGPLFGSVVALIFLCCGPIIPLCGILVAKCVKP